VLFYPDLKAQKPAYWPMNKAQERLHSLKIEHYRERLGPIDSLACLIHPL